VPHEQITKKRPGAALDTIPTHRSIRPDRPKSAKSQFRQLVLDAVSENGQPATHDASIMRFTHFHW
jgi:hypothetical protein